jgi:hypothetical protein
MKRARRRPPAETPTRHRPFVPLGLPKAVRAELPKAVAAHGDLSVAAAAVSALLFRLNRARRAGAR